MPVTVVEAFQWVLGIAIVIIILAAGAQGRARHALLMLFGAAPRRTPSEVLDNIPRPEADWGLVGSLGEVDETRAQRRARKRRHRAAQRLQKQGKSPVAAGVEEGGRSAARVEEPARTAAARPPAKEATDATDAVDDAREERDDATAEDESRANAA